MKKSLLAVTALLTVATAYAKEVVPAPVVVEEAPVQIVEKEVIVYKEKEQGFRPNGNIDLQYRYYGNTENKGYSNEWNGNNNYSRTQFQGKINMTEKQALDFRIRDYNSLDHVNGEEGENSNKAGSKDNRTDIRLRYYYNHGALTSRVKYEKVSNNQSLEYRLTYDYKNNYGTAITVGPKYKYTWNKSNDSSYSNSIGLYFDAYQQLPYGFAAELEIDGFDYVVYGDTTGNAYENNNIKNTEYAVNGKSYKPDALKLTLGAYLYQTTPLYTADNFTLSWNSEGGYDTYDWSNRSLVGHNFNTKTKKYADSEYVKYEAYLSSNIMADYKATEFVNVYAGVGAEYRNWQVAAQENVKDWRWQPYAFAGVKTTF